MTIQRARVKARPRMPVDGSFESFYETHWSAVVAVTGALCRDVGVAEELTQEAFLRAFARWRRVSELERPELWVRRVALNLAVSRFRRLTAEVRALARTRPRVAAAPVPAEIADLRDALRALPARQAQAAALFYVDDLPVAQVAEVLGCAEGTVKAHLHAARQRLRAALDHDGEG